MGEQAMMRGTWQKPHHHTGTSAQQCLWGSRYCRHTVKACAFNYKAVISYDGTNYRGYQMQAGKHAAPTIQSELERCLLQILQTDRERLNLQGAGRTDAGVHARGQVLAVDIILHAERNHTAQQPLQATSQRRW